MALKGLFHRSASAALTSVPPERAWEIRAVTVLLIGLFFTSLSAAVAWWILVWKFGVALTFLDFGMINILFALIYISDSLLNVSGHYDVARGIGIIAAGLQYVAVNILLPDKTDVVFYAVAVASAPVMIFAKNEHKGILVTYSWLLFVIFFTVAYKEYFPPVHSAPPLFIENARYIVVFFIGIYLGVTVYYYKSAAVKAQSELDQVNERLRELLANTLPSLIIDRLNLGETPIADTHVEATVLFADLVGFTNLTTSISPTRLVELLNTLFSQFDEAAERHHIEKIKTIGDCYMAASGLLGESGNQVEAMAAFALEMMRIVEEISTAFAYQLQLRVGIATGALISGVIGRKKYAYDVWGDTVNLASRMESQGEIGAIQVTEATYWRLLGKYRLEKRGEINIKGYPSALPVYTLLGAQVGDPLANAAV